MSIVHDRKHDIIAARKNGITSVGKADPWQVFRLFLIPFCVSSFSSLVKDRGFVLIFSPKWGESGVALAICAGLLIIVTAVKRFAQTRPLPAGNLDIG
ncbi:MAG: hypothetical protein HYS23_08005 [Geobacter sp.]|nr:hypothetical protein [Geobacter sp.]